MSRENYLDISWNDVEVQIKELDDDIMHTLLTTVGIFTETTSKHGLVDEIVDALNGEQSDHIFAALKMVLPQARHWLLPLSSKWQHSKDGEESRDLHAAGSVHESTISSIEKTSGMF